MGPSTAPSPMAGPSRLCAARRCSKRYFPDRLYVEIQRHGLSSERAIEPRLFDLAYRALIAARRHQRGLFRRGRRL